VFRAVSRLPTHEFGHDLEYQTLDRQLRRIIRLSEFAIQFEVKQRAIAAVEVYRRRPGKRRLSEPGQPLATQLTSEQSPSSRSKMRRMDLMGRVKHYGRRRAISLTPRVQFPITPTKQRAKIKSFMNVLVDPCLREVHRFRQDNARNLSLANHATKFLTDSHVSYYAPGYLFCLLISSAYPCIKVTHSIQKDSRQKVILTKTIGCKDDFIRSCLEWMSEKSEPFEAACHLASS